MASEEVQYLIIVLGIVFMLAISLVVATRQNVYTKHTTGVTETYAGVIPPVCLSEEDCDWARDQLLALIHRDHASIVMVQGNKKELEGIRQHVLDIGIHALREKLTERWIVLFDKPNFQGKMYLIPKADALWEATDPNANLMLNEFVKTFGFYFGRAFSALVPVGYSIALVPIPSNLYPSEPVMIPEGEHMTLNYYKGTLRQLMIRRG